MFEEQFFIRRKLNPDELINYGFRQKNDGYEYTAAMLDGQFRLFVFVTPDGAVSTKLIDCASGEEYLLHKIPSSSGAFVGLVRSALGDLLADIAGKCYEPDIFHGVQTLAVIDYVREKFTGELEFLWEKFPDCAVWRRKDTEKWYAVLATVPKRKLGIASDEPTEIIDLRTVPEQMSTLIDHVRYFPGWHMNKKHWYTIILDGSVPLAELCRRIDESYSLAVK